MSAPKLSEVDRIKRFWSRIGTADPDECWRWNGGVGSCGYGFVSIGDGRNEGAHRYMWRLLNGPVPDGICVLHRCDNRVCVNPAHLFLGTKGDNGRDCAAKFRTSKGKLSPAEVLAIRQDARSIRAIARDYGVNSSCVSRVKNRRLYAHVA